MSIETALTLGMRKFSGNFYSNIVNMNGICRYMKELPDVALLCPYYNTCYCLTRLVQECGYQTVNVKRF